MASEGDVEEERRLFYVAMTRAKKSVSIAFAQTRMRNGKHESNSPSRFINEIDSAYIANPLVKEREDGEVRRQSFGLWKKESAQSGGSGYRYGQSSRPEVVRRPQQPVRSTSAPTPVRRPQVVPKRVADADFEPTPILQLKVGQRIEHNRFGLGRILEISGNITDLIRFYPFALFGNGSRTVLDAFGDTAHLLDFMRALIRTTHLSFLHLRFCFT